MDNNKAGLKGVLVIRPHSVPGFWMVLPTADTRCLEELGGSLLKIQSVNGSSFWTMAIFFNIQEITLPSKEKQTGVRGYSQDSYTAFTELSYLNTADSTLGLPLLHSGQYH